MKYFLHDTSAFDDEKISELFFKFGYEGLGLFYTLLEKVAKQEKPIKTEILKHQLKVGKRLEKCWKFMEEIELISSNNGDTFNEQLLNFSEKYQIKKEKTRKKVSEWRERQAHEKNVTDYVPVSNLPKVKESKVNKSKIKAFVIPTIDEVKEFFKENGYNPEFGASRWHYYNDNDWHDSHGTKVLSWKQKMRSVWFKEENKIKSNSPKFVS